MEHCGGKRQKLNTILHKDSYRIALCILFNWWLSKKKHHALIQLCPQFCQVACRPSVRKREMEVVERQTEYWLGRLQPRSHLNRSCSRAEIGWHQHLHGFNTLLTTRSGTPVNVRWLKSWWSSKRAVLNLSFCTMSVREEPRYLINELTSLESTTNLRVCQQSDREHKGNFFAHTMASTPLQ